VEIIARLEEYGLLLKTDAKLPNVCSLVVGAPVRGSWWAHSRSHEIFQVLTELAAHPDVLVAKLVSGKDTFIHRTLWPAVVAIGSARQAWQIAGLDQESRALLVAVDAQDEVQATGKAALRLERSLLVQSRQVHTEAGSHAKILMSWKSWAKREHVRKAPVTQATESLEKLLDHLNRRYHGSGRLPWRGRA
jgi:hypothetical protein